MNSPKNKQGLIYTPDNFFTEDEIHNSIVDTVADGDLRTRRDFLRGVAMTGLSVPLFASLNNCGSGETLLTYGQQIKRRRELRAKHDKKVVVAEGRDIRRAVRKGFEAMGGMKQFVKKGDYVVIKPNMGWDRTPAQGANTHPQVVAAIVQLAKEAGAGKVRVFDRSININVRTYRRSGVAQASKRAGALVSYVNESQFTTVPIRGSLKLKNLKVYNEILKADVVINAPVLKHHNLSTLTMGLKNLMGMLGGHRGNYHKDIQNNIVDYNKAIFTSLTVLDMTRILFRHGPTGGSLDDVRHDVNKIAIGTDPVAVDTIGALEFGMQPTQVPHVLTSFQEGIGEGRTNLIHPIRVRV